MIHINPLFLGQSLGAIHKKQLYNVHRIHTGGGSHDYLYLFWCCLLLLYSWWVRSMQLLHCMLIAHKLSVLPASLWLNIPLIKGQNVVGKHRRAGFVFLYNSQVTKKKKQQKNTTSKLLPLFSHIIYFILGVDEVRENLYSKPGDASDCLPTHGHELELTPVLNEISKSLAGPKSLYSSRGGRVVLYWLKGFFHHEG